MGQSENPVAGLTRENIIERPDTHRTKKRQNLAPSKQDFDAFAMLS